MPRPTLPKRPPRPSERAGAVMSRAPLPSSPRSSLGSSPGRRGNDPHLCRRRHLPLLATRLANGTRSADYALEAAVCVGAVGLLRVALKPLARLVFRWWTGSTSDKSWSSSFLCWLILNVYGPLELALVAVAGVRSPKPAFEPRRRSRRSRELRKCHSRREDGAGRAGPSPAGACSSAGRSGSFTRKTLDLEVEGKTLQAERLMRQPVSTNFRTWLCAVTAVAGPRCSGLTSARW